MLPSEGYAADALDPWSGRAHRSPRRPRRGHRPIAGAPPPPACAWPQPRGRFTENHCFPDPDWAEALCARHEESRVAGVAPAVLNATRKRNQLGDIRSRLRGLREDG